MSELNKRPEKLASAIYLITSFFDDKEPLKWRLRTISTDLISESIRDKSSATREALSLFSLAKTAGLVSDTNYDILFRELSKLRDNIEKPLDFMFVNDAPPIGEILPQQQISEPAKSIKDKTNEEKPTLKEFGAVSVKKNSRQSVIVAILKRKKEVMIKDISPLISGCSEKTIQRELATMVQTGILKKIGEKRWSRYSLA